MSHLLLTLGCSISHCSGDVDFGYGVATGEQYAWVLPGASAFPTCARWPSWPTDRGRARRPSPTLAKPPGWPPRSACPKNSGRSRHGWQGCMRLRVSQHRRAWPGRRRRRSSRGWRRASRMRHCARFLAGPQIQPVLQHAQREVSTVRQDHAEQQER
jgi:hypothetical protein